MLSPIGAGPSFASMPPVNTLETGREASARPDALARSLTPAVSGTGSTEISPHKAVLQSGTTGQASGTLAFKGGDSATGLLGDAAEEAISGDAAVLTPSGETRAKVLANVMEAVVAAEKSMQIHKNSPLVQALKDPGPNFDKSVDAMRSMNDPTGRVGESRLI